MGFSIYFFRSAGLTAKGAFDMGMGQYALGAVGTMASWWLMNWVGRRTLYCWGLAILTAILIVVGALGIPKLVENGPLGWGVGACILIYTFVYDLTIGPVCYSLVAELSSTRLKAKSIVLARNFYNMAGLINNALTPNMASFTASFFLFQTVSGVARKIPSHFVTPETKSLILYPSTRSNANFDNLNR
jgi:SP family general alpha glucoside:H+ symporter-like MFS transporter